MHEDLIDKNFKVPDDFPIARMQTVIVKQINQGELLTESGIILPGIVDADGNNRMNSIKPNIGLIYSVGPGCREDLMPGLRVFYNSFCDATVMVGSQHYVMMDDRDVFVILKPKNYVKAQIIPAKEVRLLKKHSEQKSMIERLHKIEQNNKDKIVSKRKK